MSGVLAVLDACARGLPGTANDKFIADVVQARADVAELIEAAAVIDYSLSMGHGSAAEHDRLRAALASIRAAKPDWDMAQHWIDRYASGIDDDLQLDRVAEALGPPDPTEPQP